LEPTSPFTRDKDFGTLVYFEEEASGGEIFLRGKPKQIELGYNGDDVARKLRISGRGVSDCRERGKKILDRSEIIAEYLA